MSNALLNCVVPETCNEPLMDAVLFNIVVPDTFHDIFIFISVPFIVQMPV